jgi:glucose/arabinose dehydrogenase
MTAKQLFILIAFGLMHRTGNTQPPTISFQNQNITGLSAPVDIVNAGDGSNRMFLVQRTGLIKIWTGGTTTSNFIDLGPTGDNIITSAGSEQGLLSLAFHPNYDGVNNRYFYVYYTDLSGNLALRRYETTAGNPNAGDVNSDVLFLTIPHPTNSNHNGAKLNFGSDGYLYFATGDGGGAGDVPNNAQNGTSLLGKMLRLDVDHTSSYGNYAAPASNPYTSDPNIDDRIFALGLRNPFRWSFDRLNGNIWIGDVGQGAWEEINFRSAANAAAGTNYGWRCYEGMHPYNTSGCQSANSYTAPVFEYPNPGTGAAVTGGYVYRGSEYPNFRGYYIAADVYSGNIYLVWPNGTSWSSATQPGVNTIVGFGETETGVLYAVSLAGALYKVVATGGTPLITGIPGVSGPSAKIRAYPTLIEDGRINISSTISIRKLQLINSNGRVVFEKNMNGMHGSATIQLPAIPAGIYVVQLLAKGQTIREKIFVN